MELRNPNSLSVPAPIGLQYLHQACNEIYPHQTNPLQVAALVKYWLGGPDPLDYISMYSNDGTKEGQIPPHWHYVSFGLSDLHGDGRVHKTSRSGLPSGFGFELTFRLKKSPDESAPPTWPATLMQSLAKYIFSSGNMFAVGDHVSWHTGLDGREYSRIRHILLAKDPQLCLTDTPCGTVEFIQIVGIFQEELEASQKWNGLGILNLLKKSLSLGGPWLVTDMMRTENMFEINSNFVAEVESGFSTEGSNLSGVSCQCVWADRLIPRKEFVNYVYFKAEFGKKFCPYINVGGEHNTYVQKLEKNSFSLGEHIDYSQNKEFPLKILDSLHVILNKEAGLLLPLMTSGRLKHGRHFTFKSVSYNIAITFVAPNVTGTSKFVNVGQPYAVYGSWLQIYIPENFISELESAVDIWNQSNKISLPKTFYWSHRNLAISVVSEDENFVPEINPENPKKLGLYIQKHDIITEFVDRNELVDIIAPVNDFLTSILMLYESQASRSRRRMSRVILILVSFPEMSLI